MAATALPTSAGSPQRRIGEIPAAIFSSYPACTGRESPGSQFPDDPLADSATASRDHRNTVPAFEHQIVICGHSGTFLMLEITRAGGSDRGQSVNDRSVKPRFAIGRSSPPGQSGRTCRLTAYRLINENHKTFGWRS